MDFFCISLHILIFSKCLSTQWCGDKGKTQYRLWCVSLRDHYDDKIIVNLSPLKTNMKWIWKHRITLLTTNWRDGPKISYCICKLTLLSLSLRYSKRLLFSGYSSPCLLKIIEHYKKFRPCFFLWISGNKGDYAEPYTCIDSVATRQVRKCWIKCLNALDK